MNEWIDGLIDGERLEDDKLFVWKTCSEVVREKEGGCETDRRWRRIGQFLRRKIGFVVSCTFYGSYRTMV